MDNQSSVNQTPTLGSAPAPEPAEEKSDSQPKEIHHHHHCCEKRPGIGFGRILFGGILILIGFAYLGSSFGWYEVNFDISLLWPIPIIFIGLAIMSRHGWLAWIMGTLITILVLAAVAYVIFIGPVDREITTDEIVFARDPAAESLNLDINTGAGKLTVGGGADQLVVGTFESNVTSLTKTSSVSDSIQTVVLDMQGRWRGFRTVKNELDVNLASDIPADISVDSGAMDMELDLTDVTLSRLDVDTGASSLDLDIGEIVENAEVRVKAGASSLSITLPRSIGVKMNIQAGLSSKNIDEFNKVGDTQYESENYSSAEKKLSVDLELGVSSLNVNWR